MPTDVDIKLLREEFGIEIDDSGCPQRWGEELHHGTRYPCSTE